MQQFASTSAATRNAIHFEIMMFVSKPGNQGWEMAASRPDLHYLKSTIIPPALKSRAAQVRPS
jgi:hypothetical protein